MWSCVELSAQQKVAPYSRHQNHFAGPERAPSSCCSPPFRRVGGGVGVGVGGALASLNQSHIWLQRLLQMDEKWVLRSGKSFCGYNWLNWAWICGEETTLCVGKREPWNQRTSAYVTAISPVKRGKTPNKFGSKVTISFGRLRHKQPDSF